MRLLEVCSIALEEPRSAMELSSTTEPDEGAQDVAEEQAPPDRKKSEAERLELRTVPELLMGRLRCCRILMDYERELESAKDAKEEQETDVRPFAVSAELARFSRETAEATFAAAGNGSLDRMERRGMLAVHEDHHIALSAPSALISELLLLQTGQFSVHGRRTR